MCQHSCVTYLMVSKNVLRSLISSGMRLKIRFNEADFLFNSWKASSVRFKRYSITIEKTKEEYFFLDKFIITQSRMCHTYGLFRKHHPAISVYSRSNWHSNRPSSVCSWQCHMIGQDVPVRLWLMQPVVSVMRPHRVVPAMTERNRNEKQKHY